MYKPKISPITQHSDSKPTFLPACFTLLAWNLQKVEFSHFIHRPIETLLAIPVPHLLSLQEAAIHPAQNKFFNFGFAMAPNIQTAQKYFGVLTASASSLTPLRQCLTHSRELGWMTHKTALITEHLLANQVVLTHVNIHAINFVPHNLFKNELQLLWAELAHRQGPMIISGDFNTWNTTRLKTLMHATEQLDLIHVTFPDTRPIKTMMRQPLDHIFYRGLELSDSLALNVPDISDHNPLLATFCLPTNATE